MIREYYKLSFQPIKRVKALDEHLYEVVYYKDEKSPEQYTDDDEILYYETCNTTQELAFLFLQQNITKLRSGNVVVYFDGELITYRELVLMSGVIECVDADA